MKIQAKRVVRNGRKCFEIVKFEARTETPGGYTMGYPHCVIGAVGRKPTMFIANGGKLSNMGGDANTMVTLSPGDILQKAKLGWILAIVARCGRYFALMSKGEKARLEAEWHGDVEISI